MQLVLKTQSTFSYFFRYLLFWLYGFDKWHIMPLQKKPYAMDLIRFLNDRPDSQNHSIVEIGCGLGDIVRNVRYLEKYGMDMDEKALACARHLSFLGPAPAPVFHYFRFPGPLETGRVNVIVLVNWIHNIAPDDLKKELRKYFNEHLLENGMIIMDTVEHPSYRFFHSIDFIFEGLNYQRSVLGNYQNGRTVHIIQKH